MENQEFPKGVGFAPFLRSFMSNSSISIDELAVAMTMSKYAITRLAEARAILLTCAMQNSVSCSPLY